MVEYNSFTVHCYQPLSQISMTDTYVLIQHFITLLILCLYEILINKSNINLFNCIHVVINDYIIYHTVTIWCQYSDQYQCTLMYTASFIQYNRVCKQCLSHLIPGHLLCHPRSEVSVLVSTRQHWTHVQAFVRLSQIIYAGSDAKQKKHVRFF